METNSNLDSNKDKQSKKEDKKSKKGDKDAKKEEAVKQAENKPVEEEKLKFKKRIFNLTSYDDYVADKKEKLKAAQAKTTSASNTVNTQNNSFLMSKLNSIFQY